MARSWDDRADAFEAHPFRTVVLWSVGVLALVGIIGLILIPFGWGFAWLNKGAEITGPDNSQQQFTSVIGDYKSLQATAGNVCDAQSAGGSNSANDPQIVGGSPAFQYRATYRKIQADYDRRMDNLFEAGIVRHYPGLRSYPRHAPTLRVMMHQVC